VGRIINDMRAELGLGDTTAKTPFRPVSDNALDTSVEGAVGTQHQKSEKQQPRHLVDLSPSEGRILFFFPPREKNRMSPFRPLCCVLALLLASTLASAATPNTAYVDGVWSSPDQYSFSVRWTGSTSGELHLGTCSNNLVGVTTEGTNAATQTIGEPELLATCGFTRMVGTSDITIKFYAQSGTANELLFDSSVIITYPLVVEANT
jgi:hypothetical protein